MGAAPRETSEARAVAGEILRDGRGARLDSTSSKSLQSVLIATNAELGSRAIERLARVEIYGDETSYINAVPQARKGIERIFVFDGLKHLIHYHSDLIKVLGLLQAHRPGVEYQLPDGSVLSESLAFSMAGYSILANFHETRRVPMTIHDMLGPKAQAEVLAAYRGALCFVLLHELGHIELGHLKFSEVRSERSHLSLREPEALSSYQEAELEADAFAMNLIPRHARATFTPSLIFFLGAFAFIEVFSGGLSESHPLAVNRLARLVDLCEMDQADQSILVSWIGGQVENYRRFAQDRAIHGGSIRSRIAESMPADQAYAVVLEIKRRVAAQHGVLE